MVEIADIKDKESLEKWLEDKPYELAVLLAFRMAARIKPVDWAWEINYSGQGNQLFIAGWRILLTSLASTMIAKKEIVDAVVEAADSYENADAAFFSATAVTAPNSTQFLYFAIEDVASNGDAGLLDVWRIIRSDTARYHGVDTLPTLALWDEDMPPQISKAWDTTRTALTDRVEAGDTGWQFWIDWYEAQLSGAEQNWEMLKEIVLIPDADWKQGAAHVNAMIAEIVENYDARQKLTVPDTVEIYGGPDESPDQAKFQSLQQSLDRSAKTIRLQLDTLATFLRDEIETLRGRNDLSDQERKEAQSRIAILSRLLVRVETMAGEFEDDKASENALTVVEQNLPALAEDAGELAEEGGDPAVSELVISMGASIEHLTKRGTPGTLATGIAAFDHLWGGLRSWMARKKGGTP